MSPLALNDSQLHIIHTAAKFININYRDRFLHAVADYLIGQEVNDASIAVACEQVLGQMAVGVTE